MTKVDNKYCYFLAQGEQKYSIKNMTVKEINSIIQKFGDLKNGGELYISILKYSLH